MQIGYNFRPFHSCWRALNDLGLLWLIYSSTTSIICSYDSSNHLIVKYCPWTTNGNRMHTEYFTINNLARSTYVLKKAIINWHLLIKDEWKENLLKPVFNTNVIKHLWAPTKEVPSLKRHEFLPYLFMFWISSGVMINSFQSSS